MHPKHLSATLTVILAVALLAGCAAPAAAPTEVLGLAKRFSARERLVMAKLLLDSVVSEDTEDEMD